MAFIKGFFKVLWLALRPFDTLQNAIGAVGMIITVLMSLGVIAGSGALGWFYSPQTNQAHTHNWLVAAVVCVFALAFFILLAAIKLQIEKDKLNDIKFTVIARVHNWDAILEVTNEAKAATFRATVRVYVCNQPLSKLHQLYWDGYGEHVELGKGDTRSIKVARKELTENGSGIKLLIFKASEEGWQSFIVAFGRVSDEALDSVYMEVTIKPISSSGKKYKAYYVLEQPTIKELVFRKVDSLPSTSHKVGSQA